MKSEVFTRFVVRNDISIFTRLVLHRERNIFALLVFRSERNIFYESGFLYQKSTMIGFTGNERGPLGRKNGWISFCQREVVVAVMINFF